MLRGSILGFIFVFQSSLALADANNSQLTVREQQVQDSQKLQNELKQAEQAAQPNQPSTKYNINTAGIDPDVKFEITNHLFGYSTIMESDNTYSGIKLTGLVNIAYYNPSKNNDGEKKKGRFVFGFESPLVELFSRLALFGGIGATLGDARGLYVDLGLEYHLLSWFKAQAGVNYNSDAKTSPQVSVGFTW